jgi:hypothetical protein
MTLPGVNINFQSGQLGRVDDPGAGEAGMIVVMTTSPAGHAFGDVKVYASYEELPEELQAVEGVRLFFAEAPGYRLWVLPVADTNTIPDLVDYQATSPYAKDLLDSSDTIRFFGIVGASLAVLDIPTAGTNAAALREYFTTKYRYIRTFMPVTYDETLPDMGESAHQGVGFIVSPEGDEVGLFLGRRSKIRVQRNVGRVKDGPLAVSYAELVSGTPLEDDMPKVEEVFDKRFISLRTYVGKSGYYFTSDPLAVSAADDFAFDTDRAVIDKAAMIAYDTYVNEINDDVETDEDGSITTTAAKELQGLIQNAVDQAMTANGEISYANAFVDDTQNIVSTNKVEVVLGIGKKGYLQEIVVKLGWEVNNE